VQTAALPTKLLTGYSLQPELVMIMIYLELQIYQHSIKKFMMMKML